MTTPPNGRLILVVDDEHPYWAAIYDAQRAARNPAKPTPDTSKQPPPPAVPDLRVLVAGVEQVYNLEAISDLEWRDARGYITTSWLPTGEPAIGVTNWHNPATTGETTK